MDIQIVCYINEALQEIQNKIGFKKFFLNIEEIHAVGGFIVDRKYNEDIVIRSLRKLLTKMKPYGVENFTHLMVGPTIILIQLTLKEKTKKSKKLEEIIECTNFTDGKEMILYKDFKTNKMYVREKEDFYKRNKVTQNA